MPTKRQIQACKKQIEKRYVVLKRERDSLRELAGEIDELLQVSEQATNALEAAIDALSELV